jgi:hypothetical protein
MQANPGGDSILPAFGVNLWVEASRKKYVISPTAFSTWHGRPIAEISWSHAVNYKEMQS